MAAALSGVGLWVLDCLDWWTTLLSVAHEVFTQARCAAGCPPSPSRLHSCFPVSVDALFGSRKIGRICGAPSLQKRSLQGLPALGQVQGKAEGLTCIVTGPTRCENADCCTWSSPACLSGSQLTPWIALAHVLPSQSAYGVNAWFVYIAVGVQPLLVQSLVDKAAGCPSAAALGGRRRRSLQDEGRTVSNRERWPDTWLA